MISKKHASTRFIALDGPPKKRDIFGVCVQKWPIGGGVPILRFWVCVRPISRGPRIKKKTKTKKQKKKKHSCDKVKNIDIFVEKKVSDKR